MYIAIGIICVVCFWFFLVYFASLAEKHGDKKMVFVFAFLIFYILSIFAFKEIGRNEGYKEAAELFSSEYDNGYDNGIETGYEDGYDEGYGVGYEEGYEDGYKDGCKGQTNELR